MLAELSLLCQGKKHCLLAQNGKTPGMGANLVVALAVTISNLTWSLWRPQPLLADGIVLENHKCEAKFLQVLTDAVF